MPKTTRATQSAAQAKSGIVQFRIRVAVAVCTVLSLIGLVVIIHLFSARATSTATKVSTAQMASASSAARGYEPNPAVVGDQPSSLLDLTNWKLTLPVKSAHGDNPDEIKQPELDRFSLSPYFVLNDAKSGVIFRANTGGATTSNSAYPRSELREMASAGTALATWSSTVGTHTMTVQEAITHLPVVKPQVVAGQIHDASDDVVMVRLEGRHLFVEHNGTNLGDLDANYQLGTIFTVKIEVSGGHVRVSYNGVQEVDYAEAGSGWYFKAGCYTQSNVGKGDAASAYGEVVIYGLSVTHT